MNDSNKRLEEKIAKRYKKIEFERADGRYKEIEFKINDNVSIGLEWKVATKTEVLKLLIALGAATSSGVAIYNGIIENLQSTTPKEESLNNTACEKMLEAAYDKDLKKFKKAVKEGVDINSVNKYNQNALMLALGRDAFDIVDYIISTPELVNKIDFHCRDIEGNSLEEILQAKLKSMPSGKLAENLLYAKEISVLKRMQKTIEEQKNNQKKEEKSGVARSDISYAFYTQMVKTQNTK